MKHLLTALLFFITYSASAQIVNIPDTNFKQALLSHIPAIDINSDGEIQVSEASVVTQLWVNQKNISDLTGILSFTGMNYLDCSLNQLTSLNVSGLSNLAQLTAYSNDLTSIDVSNCTNLYFLDVVYNQLSTVNLAGLSNLRTFFCQSNNLTSLDFSNFPLIGHIDCNNNPITFLNVDNCPFLQNLDCSATLLTSLDLSQGLTGLTSLRCMNNQLTTLDVSACPALQNINCSYNQLTALTMGQHNLLFNMDCSFNFLTSIDISHCQALHTLIAGSNNLVYLNLKNGPQEFSVLDVTLNPNILYACVDEPEMTGFFQYYFPLHGLPNVNVNSYCSFTPGGNYNTITGSVKADLANNGCAPGNPAVPLMFLRMTSATDSSYAMTSANGNYSFYTGQGSSTITPYAPYQYFNISPANATVNFGTVNNLVDTSNFCLVPTGIHNDVEIIFLPMSPARPGFSASYQLNYKNRGTTNLSGNIQLNFDESRMTFSYASTAVTSQTSGMLTWSYNNLLPFESKIINIKFDLLPPPVNNIDDTLYYLATINPVANDETPEDNSFILPQKIIASYDPNDKECLQGSRIAYTDIGKFLHYIIRFQNLGTDTAFNIVVADTLSNKLDWNTLEFVSSSHTCDVRRRNGKLEFFFQNIHLPYSAINEPASHGFVSFKIKPKPTVIIGDSLNNRAAIYFDFNLPVITNTATTIVSPVGPVPVRLEYFSAAAKGNTNILNWKAACSDGTTTFGIERSSDGIHFSKIGNITATNSRCQLPFNFIDIKPLAGKNYYRLKITDVDGISFYSKVLVVGDNNQSLEVMAVGGLQNSTIVYFISSKQQKVEMKLMATDGKIIYSSSKTIAVGTSQVDLQVRNLAKGVYTLLVYTNEGKIITRKFIK